MSTYTFDQEVIDARGRLEHDFPELRFLWDNETHEHLIIEHCKDGTDALVFKTKTFLEQAIRERLHRADCLLSDPFDEIEKHNDAIEREQDRRFEDQIGDVGERLAWAFAKDGLTVRPKISVGKGIPSEPCYG